MFLKNIPRAAMEELQAVFDHGDVKYGKDQWLNNGKPLENNVWDHVFGAQRHIARFRRGELLDESGRRALAHVAARALMALSMDVKMQGECDALRLQDEDDVASCDLIVEHIGPHKDFVENVEWK